MIIVYGTRCYGRADAIEGLGHVTCKFVHIMFVPLIPIETLFLVDDDRGMKLPFSFKAALSGWLRAGAILTGLGMGALAVENFAEGEPILGAVCVVIALLSFAGFPFWGWILSKCSQQRKQELMAMMGMHSQEAPAQAPAYPQQAPGYGAPPMPSYGAPMPAPGYGGPAPGYGGPAQGYGPPPPAGGYGAPAPYGTPQQPGYGAPPAQAYGGPQPQGYAGPRPQPQGYGGPQPPAYGYGPPGYDPNRR